MISIEYLQLRPQGTLRGRGAILEVVSLVTSPCNQLVPCRALWHLETVGVQIVLQFYSIVSLGD